MIRVLGISGSLRAGSYNTALLYTAQELASPTLQLDIASLRGIPFYDEDERAHGWPTAVTALGEAVRHADAVLIATPEYNFSIPGVLKNALDWLSRLPEQPFARKPVALLGASTGRLGTVRAQAHLRHCFQCLDARPLNKPEVLVAHAAEAFAQGRLREPAALEALRALLAALASMVHQSK